MKVKVLVVLVLVAALAGGWKWSNQTVSKTADPPAYAHGGDPVVAPTGWTWGEE